MIDDTWAKTKKKKKKRRTLTHDPGPTLQLVQNIWFRITGKSKCPGYLAQYLKKKKKELAKFMIWDLKKKGGVKAPNAPSSVPVQQKQPPGQDLQ